MTDEEDRQSCFARQAAHSKILTGKLPSAASRDSKALMQGTQLSGTHLDQRQSTKFYQLILRNIHGSPVETEDPH